MVLLCLGLVGTALGLLLLCAAMFGRFEGRGFRRLGAVYFVASLGLLGLRAALIAWDDWRKRRYATPIKLEPVPHVTRLAPAPVIEKPAKEEERNGAQTEAEQGGAQ